MSWLQKAMYGRNGADQLSITLLALYAALYLLSVVTKLSVFRLVAIVPAGLSCIRILSRNVDKRRQENARFLARIDPLIRWVRLHHTMRTDRDHRYFKCPNCGQRLRVPRGKGKVQITCRSCGVSFEKIT